MEPPSGPDPRQFLSIDWVAASSGRDDQSLFASKPVSVSPPPQRKLSALDLTGIHNENPLQRKGSLRRVSPHQSIEELRRQAEITPPDYLTDSEYFELANFLCDHMTEEEVKAIPSEILRRFAKQAIRDVKYMQALIKKAINEQDKIPAGIRATIIGKLFGLQEAYDTLLHDFKACKRTFSCGDTLLEERDVLNPIDSSERYVLLTNPRDMTQELKNRWKQLIRYMDQLRATMPAPSECCPAQLVPNIRRASFQEKMPVAERRMTDNARPKFEALKSCIGEMEENWRVLETMIRNGSIPPFVKADAVNFHVCLPNQAKPLPPCYDVSQLVVDTTSRFVQEKAAPGIAASHWLVSGKSKSSDLDSRKEFFRDKASAEACKKRLDDEDRRKRKEAKMRKGELSLSVPSVKTVSRVNPKPSEYFEFQPVSLDTLQQVLDKGKLLIRQAKQPLEDLIASTAGQDELTEDQYELFLQHYATLQKSIEMWHKHFPSVQEVYDFVYEEDSVLKKGVRAILSGAARGAHILQLSSEKKKHRQFERRTTDTALSAKNRRQIDRHGSLPDLMLSAGRPVFQMQTIPPTPSPTSSGSPYPSASVSASASTSPERLSPEEKESNGV